MHSLWKRAVVSCVGAFRRRQPCALGIRPDHWLPSRPTPVLSRGNVVGTGIWTLTGRMRHARCDDVEAVVILAGFGARFARLVPLCRHTGAL
jgi:hypothetical protein